MKLWRQIFLVSLSGAATFFASSSLAEENPFPVWNLLQQTGAADEALDFMTIEWEYFMIHDYEGKFNGALGYVLTNPKDLGGIVGNIMPKGGNLAFGGQVRGGKAIGQYHNFGIAGTKLNTGNRDIHLLDPDSGMWASMEGQFRDGPTLVLKGRTDQFAWDLSVTNAVPELMEKAEALGDAFLPVTDKESVGRLPGENWTVDGLWPKAFVRGSITVLETGEVLEIDGKGYRENSWGRYAMPLDGWDFLVFSEYADEGVIAVVQTYHKSTKLDFLDLSFADEGRLELRRFRAEKDEFRWKHKAWSFHRGARQCVPNDWLIEAEDQDYRLVMEATIDANAQEPFLSDATLGTRIFFIHEQYPKIKGQIFRKKDGSLVKSFEGQAGGEFALHKSLWSQRSDTSCAAWGQKFSN